MKKRGVSMLLALLLLFGMLPMGISQAEASHSYELYIDGIQVNDENKDAILGKNIRYDPERNELIFKSPYSSTEHDLIENHIEGLTIWTTTGVRLEANQGHSIINSSTDLVVRTMCLDIRKGDAVLHTDTGPAVVMSGNSTLLFDHVRMNITGGTAAVSGTENPNEEQTLIFQTSSMKLSGTESAVANMRGGVRMANTAVNGLEDGKPVIVSDGTLADAEGKLLKQVEARPTVSAFRLQIDGVQVYEDNKDDILEDGGRAKFDPNTQTLTLINPSFADRHDFLILSSPLVPLTIQGKGILETKYNAAYRAEASISKTIINGDFIFSNQNSIKKSPMGAINFTGELCFAGGTIFVNGYETGLEALGDVSFAGGTVSLSGDLYPIIVQSDKKVFGKNGITIISPEDGKMMKAKGTSFQVYGGWVVVDKNGKPVTKAVFGQGNPFVDVKKGAYYYNAVLWAVYHKPYQVTAGIDKTHFGPDRTVTRAQAMTFFWAALNRPKFKKANTQFVDVKKTDWFYKSVMWAVENGVTAGTDATHFSPNKTCNRGEILAFLYASLKKPKVKIKNPYKDVSNQWYKKAALWAWVNRIERGEDGKFNASTPCTRASTVTYLYRFLTGYGLVE